MERAISAPIPKSPVASASSNAKAAAPKSSFRNALVRVPVPRRLLDGLQVLRVSANGRTRPSFLTLSEDKFTLYLTTARRNPGDSTRLSILGLRRSQSEGATPQDQRAIDIGSIERVHRGQATHKFVMAKYVVFCRCLLPVLCLGLRFVLTFPALSS